MKRALLIMGPTASGKSALALALAERVDGEIVNADASQIYADLRILSARPSTEEEARTPHHLYGCIDASERFTVARWLEAALAKIEAIAARGKTPILVGGTGLYFKALTKGLADIPEIPTETRAALRERLEREGVEALHADLARLDPPMAEKLKPKDQTRILRALEVVEATGASILDFQAETKPALAQDRWRGAALTPERSALYAAIDARFQTMLAQGALEEVRALSARNLDPDLPAMKALGVPSLLAHLKGQLSLSEAAELASRETRRYAKRQSTWIANQMPAWAKLEDASLPQRLEKILALVNAVDGPVRAN